MHYVLENQYRNEREKQEAIESVKKQVEDYLVSKYDIHHCVLQPDFSNVKIIFFLILLTFEGINFSSFRMESIQRMNAYWAKKSKKPPEIRWDNQISIR